MFIIKGRQDGGSKERGDWGEGSNVGKKKKKQDHQDLNIRNAQVGKAKGKL